MKKYHLLFLFSIIMTMISCVDKTDPYTTDFAEDQKYFPLTTGNTWIYEVDSIIYDNNGTKVDTIHHIIKEEITGSFIDNEGIKNYIIERYIKSNFGWTISKACSATKNEKQAIRNEDNLRFIKLVFPIKENYLWNGNAYFDSENIIVKIAGEPIKMYEYWNYRYISKDVPDTIDNRRYDNVATVEEVNYENSIEKRYSIEKYGKGVGLIYKEMYILNTQKIDQVNIPWEQKAEEGFILKQKLISFSGG